MASDLQIRFARSLIQKTANGGVQWNVGSVYTDHGVLAEFNDLIILLQHQNGRNGYIVEIKIYKNGMVIETISDEIFGTFDLDESGGEGPYEILLRLYYSARRQALGADEALVSLIEELG